MKQCAIASSSSRSFAASESDPEDSFWRDFNFDFSFLTSDDHKTPLDDSNTAPKAEESELDGLDVVKEKESSFSPLFTKMSALRIKECSNSGGLDNTEVDSPCWRGTKSLNFSRSRDDLNVLYGLNPMAPQFIPSNVKINLDKNGKEFGENGSSSLKRSLSSNFPPSSGEFSINDLYETGIEQGSDPDESLGLVCEDSVFKTMGVLDICNQLQRPTKLDPLAPVFVPSYAKPSAVVHEKPGVAEDHMIATEENVHSTYASRNVHEFGATYSSNPRLASQVQNTKLASSSNKTHGSKKKLNPLAPQFSLADTKPKVYGSVENQAANDLPTNVNSSVLFSPAGYRNLNELHTSLTQTSVPVDTKQMGRHRSNLLHGNSSAHMDVKKLLTTIHGLSELLTHVIGSESSGSPNEQDLDLINCTVQNLKSYINNGVQEHTGIYAGAGRSSCGLISLPDMCKQSIRGHQSANIDFKRKEKYSMVSGEIGAEPQFEYGVPKENGFGQVERNHQTEEQINPQVFFYRSLWLKARADRSLMEYERYLSNSRT